MDISLPTFEVIEAIHEIVLTVSGGRPGIHDEKLIHSAVERPQTYINYIDSYDLDTICAILIDSIARYHGFNDGNKRTALMTTIVTYKTNNVSFKATKEMNQAFDSLVMWVVTDKPDIDKISIRLKELRKVHTGGKATLRNLIVSYIITKNSKLKKEDFGD